MRLEVERDFVELGHIFLKRTNTWMRTCSMFGVVCRSVVLTSTVISITHCGTVSFSSMDSVSPPESLHNNLKQTNIDHPRIYL